MRIAVGLAAIAAWVAVEARDATLQAHGTAVVVVRPAPSVGAKGAVIKGPAIKGPAIKGAAVKGAAHKAPTPISTWSYDFSANNPTYDLKCAKGKQKKGCQN
jgi:hypothetical protein